MISRRALLGVLAGAGFAGAGAARAAEPPPETTVLRLAQTTSICHAPQYLAEALLRAEGFTTITYGSFNGLEAQALGRGDMDMTLQFAGPLIIRIDQGDPVVLVGGGHVGCLELWAREAVRSLRDLRGKTVIVYGLESAPHIFLASVLALVGLDHRKDVQLLARPPAEAIQTFSEGKADAVITSPPFSQELRARRVGHVLVNSTTDRPWSQYFCCMVGANREFARTRPVATKRALRAILKAADLCGAEPSRAARALVDRGFTARYEYAEQAMKELPYGRWRQYNPEDSVRFYALRLHEAGMIKGSPQKLIAGGTDWRFIRELQKELKA